MLNATACDDLCVQLGSTFYHKLWIAFSSLPFSSAWSTCIRRAANSQSQQPAKMLSKVANDVVDRAGNAIEQCWDHGGEAMILRTSVAK